MPYLPEIITGIVIALVAIIILANSIKIVSQANAYVVEFLGKYKRTLPAGFNLIIPGIEKVAKKVMLKEQVFDFPPQPVITKDNVTILIDTVVYFSINNPVLYTYGAANPIYAIENLTATTLRNIMGELELDEALTSRDFINDKLRIILDEATDPWGIKINRVELKNILPPEAIQTAMEKQMKAERDRRETLLEAEGHKQAIVTRGEGEKAARILEAEGRKQAALQEAEGRARAIEMIYQAEATGLSKIKNILGDEGVITLKKLEALKKAADGRATKIIMPTELASSASTLSFAAEMLGTKGAMPMDKTEQADAEWQGDYNVDSEAYLNNISNGQNT